jgi:hypothetical protein
LAKKKDTNAIEENESSVILNSTKDSKIASKSSNAKYEYVLKNKKSRNEVKHKKLITVIAIILVVILLGVGLFYGMYTFVKINSFKVFIDSSGSKVLSLSTDRSFSFGSEILEINGPGTMDNTTLASGENLVSSPAIEDRLPTIVTSDGFECSDTDRFIASTFYLKNTTGIDQSYCEVLSLRNTSNSVETAMRVMLIRDYEILVYATNNDGELEKVVPLSTPYTEFIIEENTDESVTLEHIGEEAWLANDFYSDEYVFYNEGLTLTSDQIIKYSIIIWLEGWDEDCTDDKLSGIIQMDFAFSQNEIS